METTQSDFKIIGEIIWKSNSDSIKKIFGSDYFEDQVSKAMNKVAKQFTNDLKEGMDKVAEKSDMGKKVAKQFTEEIKKNNSYIIVNKDGQNKDSSIRQGYVYWEKGAEKFGSKYYEKNWRDTQFDQQSGLSKLMSWLGFAGLFSTSFGAGKYSFNARYRYDNFNTWAKDTDNNKGSFIKNLMANNINWDAFNFVALAMDLKNVVSFGVKIYKYVKKIQEQMVSKQNELEQEYYKLAISYYKKQIDNEKSLYDLFVNKNTGMIDNTYFSIYHKMEELYGNDRANIVQNVANKDSFRENFYDITRKKYGIYERENNISVMSDIFSLLTDRKLAKRTKDKNGNEVTEWINVDEKTATKLLKLFFGNVNPVDLQRIQQLIYDPEIIKWNEELRNTKNSKQKDYEISLEERVRGGSENKALQTLYVTKADLKNELDEMLKKHFFTNVEAKINQIASYYESQKKIIDSDDFNITFEKETKKNMTINDLNALSAQLNLAQEINNKFLNGAFFKMWTSARSYFNDGNKNLSFVNDPVHGPGIQIKDVTPNLSSYSLNFKQEKIKTFYYKDIKDIKNISDLDPRIINILLQVQNENNQSVKQIYDRQYKKNAEPTYENHAK